MRHLTCALLLLALIAVVTSAQTPPAEKAAELDEAEQLLLRIDEAIYYPSRHGLKDFRFRWKTSGTGVFEELNKDLFIAYAWKSPAFIRLEYVNGEGERIEKLPEISKHPELVKVFKQLEASIHGMAQQHLVGAPYAVIYSDYYKRVVKRVVNNKVEYDVVLTPKKKKHVSQVAIKIIEGLPRRVTKTFENGDSIRAFHRWEKRGDKHLHVGLRVEHNNQLVSDETYNYTRIDGIHVFNELVRASMAGEKKRETMRLDRLQVNIGLADEYFTSREGQKGDK